MNRGVALRALHLRVFLGQDRLRRIGLVQVQTRGAQIFSKQSALTVNGNISVLNTGVQNFGSTTRQMINFFEQAPTSFGIGVQSGTLYQRVNASGGFAWFQGGNHSDAQNNPGTAGTVRMTLDAAGQLRTTTGTIATLSDARLKDQVHDYSRALDQINALRPVSYQYRDAGKAPSKQKARETENAALKARLATQDARLNALEARLK